MRERIYRWLDLSTAATIVFLLPVLVGATTYTFTQTNWAGGITANTATHTSNQTGWSEYSATSTSMGVVNAGADLQIATSTTSVTQTNDGSTNTGFNLAGAAFSTTEVVSSGSAASIRLETGASSDIVTSEGNQYTDIAVDSNNKAHLSFIMDRTGANNDLYHATNATNTEPWSVYKVADNISEGGTSIGVGPDNFQYISYHRNGDLGYATNASGSWVEGTVDAGVSNTGAQSSIAVDSNNKAHISYQDVTNNDIDYATNASGSWATTTIDGVGASVGPYSSIAVDSNDKIHIAYYSTTATELRYATNASGSWATSTVDTDGPVGTYNSIAIDSNNKVHISYADATNNFQKLRYATNATSSSPWTIERASYRNNAAGFASPNALALDSSGNPRITYYNNALIDLELTTSTAGSGIWATSTLASAGSVGSFNSIAIDSNDNYHVITFDTVSGILYLSDQASYVSSGTFTSGPMSLGVGALGWGNLSWTNTLNGGTITLKARSDADGDFSNATAWGSCANITSGAALSTGNCVTNGHTYIQYQATLTTPDTSTTPILSDVTIGYATYVTNQTLTSSVFNTESVTTAIDFLSWIEEAILPTNTSVLVELRTASTSSGITSGTWYDFNSVTVNCTKTADTVTCPASALPLAMKDVTYDQYVQYRTTLSTTAGSSTPTVSEVQIGYVPEAGVGPTVNTQDASSLTSSTATLNGNITGTGGTDVTVRGFAYGTDSTFATVIATTTDTTGQPFSTGTFTHPLTGLTCGTTYYVRAYATNTAGTGFGFDEMFNLSCETATGGVSSSGPGGGGDGGAPPQRNEQEAGPMEEEEFRLPVFNHTERDRRFDPARTPEVPDISGPDAPVIDAPIPPPESLPSRASFPTAPEIFRSVASTTQAVARQAVAVIEQAVPVAVPLGALSGTLAFAGTAIPLGGANLLISLARLWHLLLSALGFRKRKPWGVVYDSVTKHPLDPVTIKLTDQYGKAIETGYTDFDGRYGFLVTPGAYRLEVEKQNYIFPSTSLKGKLSDGLYTNLYFGGLLTIIEDGTLMHNIPLDPVGLDWKEFGEQSGKHFHFYSELERAASFLMRWIFRLGFVAALYVLVTAPSVADASVVALYAFIGLLRFLGFGPRPYGYLMDKETGKPLAFAHVTVKDALTKQEVARTVTDHLGRYYALVPNGEYVVEVSRKEGEEYTRIFTSEAVHVKRGVVRERVRV